MAEDITKLLPIHQEIATTRKDIDIFDGYLNRLENPDPVLLSEANGRGLRLYDEVDRDAHAGAVLQTRCLGVAGLEFEVVPVSEKRADKKIAEFVYDRLAESNFTQAIQELMQSALYGFYTTEIIWRDQPEGLGIKKFICKHPRRFCFDFERNLRLITLEDMIEGEELPDRKFICHTFGDSDNPYGKGLGQRLWWPVWFKKNGIKFWMTFLDKFGSPTIVGKYPPSTGETEQNKLLAAIELIHQETGITIPENMAVELLEAARGGNASYEKMCEYMDRQMSKTVLGQNLTTEVSGGSYAASQTHNSVREDIVNADSDAIAETLNETVVRWLADYNFPNVKRYPQLQFRTDSEPDLKLQAERDEILTSKIGVPIATQYFYDTYDVPAPKEGEDSVGGKQQQTSMADDPDDKPDQDDDSDAPDDKDKDDKEKDAKEKDSKDFAEKLAESDFEKFEKRASLAAQTAFSDFVKEQLDLVMGADSWEDIGEKIYTKYPHKSADEFQDILARSLFVAGLAGYGAASGDK